MSFDATDLAQIQKGNGPFVMPSEGMGLRTRYEIHHIDQIQHGGEVYDMDNFSIMTPREHINMHRKDNNHDI
jgi:hypothetical protein